MPVGTVSIPCSDTIEFVIHGSQRESTGVSRVVLEPVRPWLPLHIGEMVVYRVAAIHRETIER